MFVELENKGIHSTALDETRLTSAMKYARFMKMVVGGSHGIVQGMNKGSLMSSNLLKVCMVVWLRKKKNRTQIMVKSINACVT